MMEQVRNVNNSIETSPSEAIRVVTSKVLKFISWSVWIDIEIVPVGKMSHSALKWVKKRSHS